MDELDRAAGLEPPIDDAILDDVLVRVIETDEQPEMEIRDLRDADYLLERLGDLQRRRQGYVDQVALWQRAGRSIERAIDWLERQLRNWGAKNRSAHAKSFDLAHGRISTRQVPATLEVADQDAAVEWAIDQAGELVNTKQTVNASEIRDVVKFVERPIALDLVERDSGDSFVVELEGTEAEVAEMIERAQKDDRYTTTVVYETVVVDSRGEIVPGVAYVPPRISVSVRPNGL